MDEDDETWESRYLAQRAQEEADEKARHDAQLAQTDLTPGEPTGAWVVEWHFRDSGVINTPFDDHRAAERDGGQKACMTGTTAVRVLGPDGTVHWSYHRSGNFWLRHSDFARAKYDQWVTELWASKGVQIKRRTGSDGPAA